MHAHGVRAHFFDQLDMKQLEVLRRIGEQVLEHLMAVKRSSPEELELLNAFVQGSSFHPAGNETSTR